MGRSAWLVAIVLVGCVAAPAPATPIAPSAAARSSTDLAPGPTISASPAAALAGLLPTELDGVELHTFAVGQDILERLAERLGTSVDRFETGYASEHGARFFQVHALRLFGTDGSTLLDAWTHAAYPAATPDVTVDQADLGGHLVTVVNAPSAAARIGTFYAYALTDALLVVQAFDAEVAAEVLAALP